MDRTSHHSHADSEIRRSQAGVGLALAALIVGIASNFPAEVESAPQHAAFAAVAGESGSVADRGDRVILKVEAFDLAKFGPASYGD